MKRERRDFLKALGSVSIVVSGGTKTVEAASLNDTRSYAVDPSDTDGYLAIEEVASNLVTSDQGSDPGFKNRLMVLRNNQSVDQPVTADISISSWGSNSYDGYLEVNGNDVGQSTSITLDSPGDSQSIYVFVPNDPSLAQNNFEFGVTASAPNKDTRTRSLQSTLTYVEVKESAEVTNTATGHEDITAHTNVDTGHSDVDGGFFSDHANSGHDDVAHEDNHTNEAGHDDGFSDTAFEVISTTHDDVDHADFHQDNHTDFGDHSDDSHDDFKNHGNHDNHSNFDNFSDFGNHSDHSNFSNFSNSFSNFSNFGNHSDHSNFSNFGNHSNFFSNSWSAPEGGPEIYHTEPTDGEQERARQIAPEQLDEEANDEGPVYGTSHEDSYSFTDNPHENYTKFADMGFEDHVDVPAHDDTTKETFQDFADNHSDTEHEDTGFSNHYHSDFHTDQDETSYYFTDSFQDVAETSHTNVETTKTNTTYYETTVEDPGYPSGEHSDSFSDFVDHSEPFVDVTDNFSDFAQARFSDGDQPQETNFTDFGDFSQSVRGQGGGPEQGGQ